MAFVIAFVIIFVVTAVAWVAAVTVYNLVVGGFNFGELSAFVGKSAVLVAATTALAFIPYGGWLALAVWWFGVVAFFGMDFWEAKIIVIIIWLCSLAISLIAAAALAS